MNRAPGAAPGTAAALEAALEGALPEPPAGLGIAVSGGGDSVALLVLMAEWAAPRGVALSAATVDHGLRPEAAAEAASVAALCARLGMPHTVLRWDGPGARGNLMEAARKARQRLLGGWAAKAGLAAVALGHTRDDQAETVLMQLARGAGVDGLSAMAPARHAAGTLWLRPLLAVPRASLRAELTRRGLGWAEDPTNSDDRYLRARTRRALAALAPLGLGAGQLAATARRMATARAALQAATAEAASRLARPEAGDLLIDTDGLLALPAETRARLLGTALAWMGNAEHPPRRAALDRLEARLRAGRPATLHGCRLTPARTGDDTGPTLRLSREWRAVAGHTTPPHALWDGRWRLIPPEGCTTDGLHLGPLGADGLRACPDPRATGLPRASLVPTPAVWHGPSLVAAPLAGLPEGWRAELRPGTLAALFADPPEPAPPAADFPPA